MHASAACGVYVPERVDLEAVRNAGVDVCENAAVEERVGSRVDVELVAAKTHTARDGTEKGRAYTVAGSVVFLPRKPPAAPESALEP